MKLASRRFSAARMGAEMHGHTIEHLEWLLSFRPEPDSTIVLHLPRTFNLMDQGARDEIHKYARHFKERLYGMVLHDHPTLVSQRTEYLDAVVRLNEELIQIQGGPVLFIEYAVGLSPEDFANFFKNVVELQRIGCCIDIGHVGIRAAQTAYAASHPGDICALKTQPPDLASLMPEVDAAVNSAVSEVLALIRNVAILHKPLHFHLHDGHPLSTFSPFGVSDHLSFFREIPLGFEYRGRRAVSTMFGPSGLGKVVQAALASTDPDRLSFTLEIHPTSERLPLGDAADLFPHWTDKTNAEQMNHWLSVLSRNHALLLEILSEGFKIQHGT
jgi:hypothetical protein